MLQACVCTGMANILVYLPNISTDTLIELLRMKMGDLEPWVAFEKLPGKTRFRAPELSIVLKDRTQHLYITVIQYLIEAAKILGASQFTFEKEGYAMQRQPTDAPPRRIEHLAIALNVFEIEQINIY